MLKIRLGATAAHVYPVGAGANAIVRVYNRTANGAHYEVEPADPALPAALDVELTYQFGRPARARLEYDPASGWHVTHPGGSREPAGSRPYEPGADYGRAHIRN